MKQKVIILAGLPGSGKSTAAGWFRTQQIPVIRMGDMTDELLEEQGLKRTEQNERAIRDQIRSIYGNDIYAKRTVQLINQKHKKDLTLAVEGMRSVAELDYFKSHCENVIVVYIQTTEKTRYRRLASRKERPLTEIEARSRDEWEVQLMGIDTVEKQATTVIENEGSENAFYTALTNIL